jgi:hypothetical protein
MKKKPKLNPKIELIKLRSKAKGDPKIPIEKRAYLNIFLPRNTKPEFLPMFVNMNWSIGKMLDYTCAHAKVRNENLDIKVFDKNGSVIPFDQVIEKCITNSIVENGGFIILERSKEDFIDLSLYNI